MSFTFPIVLQKPNKRRFIVSVVTILFDTVGAKSKAVYCLPKAQQFWSYRLQLLMVFWVIQLLFAITEWDYLFGWAGLSMMIFLLALCFWVFFPLKVKKTMSWPGQLVLFFPLWSLHFKPSEHSTLLWSSLPRLQYWVSVVPSQQWSAHAISSSRKAANPGLLWYHSGQILDWCS